MTYLNSKNWNMFIEDDKLFITKGSDEIYYFDEATEEQAKKIYDAYLNHEIDYLMNDNEYREIIEKLEKTGVIYQKKYDSKKQNIKIYIRYFGEANDSFKSTLLSFISKRKNIKLVDKINNSDLVLFIRINVPLKNVLEDYSKLSIPHILIDLGYSHNISIGPIVFDNTSCLGCYIGRIVKNWGDSQPPIEPAVTNHSELISSFIIERIEEFIIFGNCPDLINHVWNYNTSTHQSDFNRIYKLPWCPHCTQEDEDSKISLPWIKEFHYE